MFLLHSQAEQIGLCDNEVQILVEQLGDMFGCASSCCLCSEVFEEDTREGGEEVDVSGGIESLL